MKIQEITTLKATLTEEEVNSIKNTMNVLSTILDNLEIHSMNWILCGDEDDSRTYSDEQLKDTRRMLSWIKRLTEIYQGV